jgi:hypothetical protein
MNIFDHGDISILKGLLLLNTENIALSVIRTRGFATEEMCIYNVIAYWFYLLCSLGIHEPEI